MKSNELEYRKIWIAQCETAEVVRQKYGLPSALDYLIGDKLLNFVAMAEHRYEFAAELPHFVDGIRRIFTAKEISSYLEDLERDRFLSPSESEDDSGLDEEDSEGGLLDGPVLGAQELLRFARVKAMLQAEG